MLEPDQWDSILGSVTGTIIHGTERVSSNRLMDLLDVENDRTRRREVGKRLVSVMRANGWHGPRPMRIPGDNGHVAGCSGYWRSPFRPRQPTGPVEGDVESDVESLSDELPEALERVTRLGLKKLERVLRAPLDTTDSNLTRSQVTAAGIAVNAQLRADEQRLKAKVQGDVLDRLLKAMAEEKKRLSSGGAGVEADVIDIRELREAVDKKD
jgi:hypothetical protein